MSARAVTVSVRSCAIAAGSASSSANGPAPVASIASAQGPSPLIRARYLADASGVGEVSDVVDAVLYLENAPFVTGEILHVDGGQSAGH